MVPSHAIKRRINTLIKAIFNFFLKFTSDILVYKNIYVYDLKAVQINKKSKARKTFQRFYKICSIMTNNFLKKQKIILHLQFVGQVQSNKSYYE